MTSGRSICTRCAARNDDQHRIRQCGSHFLGVADRGEQVVAAGDQGRDAGQYRQRRRLVVDLNACRNSTRVATGVAWIMVSLNAATLRLMWSAPKDAVLRIGRSIDRVAPRVRCTSLGE